MMQEKKYLINVFWLTLAGTLFAGYLTGVKLFTGVCALNEPCPYFLGYPACWYGFGFFLTMFLISAVAYSRKQITQNAVISLLLLSGAGILFAGSFVWKDISLWLASSRRYALVLPSCVYGLVFYIIIFSLSISALMKRKGTCQ